MSHLPEQLQIETHSTPLIVILGKPGIGKTTLLRQVMNHQRIKNLFEEKILTAFLEDGAPYVYYPIWFETVWPNNYSMLNRKMDDQDYAKFIRSRLQSEKYLLLIDDVSSAKYAKELLLADLSQSSTTIITTSNKEIAKELRRCYDCEFVEIPPFSINEVEELYFRASGEIFHSEERPLVDELRHLLQGNPLGLLLSFPELRKLSLPEYVKLLNLDDTIIPLELEKEVFLPLQIAYDHMNGQVKEWFLDIARLPFLHSYDQNFLGLSFGKENQQGDLITRKIIEKINDVTTAFERVSNDHQGWKINHQVWLFAKSISKRECEDHELLEKASHNSFYKNTFINLPNSSVIETIKFDLGINRPEELKSTTNLFQSFIDFFKSPGYLTDWNIITQNKANLTSQEYVYAYYIHNNEYRQRFGYYLGFLYPGTLILFASLVYLLTIFHAIHLTEHYVWIFVFLQKTLLIFLPAFLIGSAIINIHDQIQWNKLFFIITDRMK